LPELGSEEYFTAKDYKVREEAIFAARADTNEVLRGCNEVHRERKAEALLNRAPTPSAEAKKPSRPNIRLIDR
jgi:hypothetical protein